jgi:phosphatidylinositol-3-phosphatase
MKKIVFLSIFCLVLASCSPGSSIAGPVQQVPVVFAAATATQLPAATATQSPAATEGTTATAIAIFTATSQVSAPAKVPDFDHIVLIMLENEYYQDVIGNPQLPHLNALAQQNVLLSNYFGIGHPSLPNYLALVSGSTQNVSSDCMNCFFDQPNLADEIEASGRTWKSYQESMPSHCFIGDAGAYAQWTNPFLYFDSIRLDKTRCDRSIVPLSQLNSDLAANQLPNFSLIMPNLCDSGHSCVAGTADNWVNGMVDKLQASPALGQNSLIVISFDEGVERNTARLNADTSGQIATVLISPMARQGFNDPAHYSHYSLLKTFLTAWNLPALGDTAEDSIQPIVEPWDTQLDQ